MDEQLARMHERRARLAHALASSQETVLRARETRMRAREALVVAEHRRDALRARHAQFYPDSCPPGANDSAPVDDGDTVSACGRQTSMLITAIIRQSCYEKRPT
jgi:hypothetical protein